MGCQKTVILGDNLTFTATTHTPATGALVDADAVPAYRVYEDETGTAISNDDMAKLDDANTLGFYSELLACTTANGYEVGKSYSIYITAVVGGVTGGLSYSFTVAEDIGAVIAIGFPENNTADAEPGGGEVVTGTNTANDGDSTFLDDGTYWQIAAAAADGDGFGLSVIQTFTLGLTKKANLLKVNAKEDLIGAVHVWFKNYITGLFEQVSDASTAISGGSDDNYSYAILPVHQQATDGEVQVRYTSTDTSTNKYLYLDQVLLQSVTAGPTLAEIAEAVWGHAIAGQDELTAGYALDKTRVLVTTVAVADTATSFTLTAGVAVADAYNGMIMMIEDRTDGHYETRRIVDYTAGRVVTLDRALGFTPEALDEVYIQASGYGDVNVQAMAANVVTAAAIADGAIDNATLAADAINAASVKADAVTKIQSGLAVPGDAMTLAADSIKKVTFDESTAWPLLAADAGATQVARVGADGDTLETLSDQLDATVTAGAGAVTFTFTVQDAATDPIEGVAVWVTSDADGSTVVAGTLYTDASGEVVFYLDAATYYFWKQDTRYNFTNPVAVAVS